MISNYLINNSNSEQLQSGQSFSKSPKHQNLLFRFNSKKAQAKESGVKTDFHLTKCVSSPSKLNKGDFLLHKARTNKLIQNVDEEEIEEEIQFKTQETEKKEKIRKITEEEEKAIKRKKIEEKMLSEIEKPKGPSTNTLKRKEFEEMMMNELMGGGGLNNSKDLSSNESY